MPDDEIAPLVAKAAFELHRKPGLGLLESVFDVRLASEVIKLGLQVEREEPTQIELRKERFDEVVRNELVINEACPQRTRIHSSPCRHHWQKTVSSDRKLSNFHLGFLVNFGGRLF